MLRLSTGLRDALLGTQSFKDIFMDGVIYIYSGSQPSSADAAVQGTLLGKVTQDAGSFSFGTATNGLEFDAPSDGMIAKAAAENWQFEGLADGVAGWARLMGNANDDLAFSESLPRLDFSVGRTGADLNLSNTNIAQGAIHTIDVFEYAIPAQ